MDKSELLTHAHPFPPAAKNDRVQLKVNVSPLDLTAILLSTIQTHRMTEAIESSYSRPENGHAQDQNNAEEKSRAPSHQKQSSMSCGPPALDSGVMVPPQSQSSANITHASTSPSYIQKSGDGEDEDYDPYPYGSAMSPSFVPPTPEAIAQAQADQAAMLQQHQAVQQPKLQGKGKDLSHVPCRFFKIGGCTAGLACPFSHSLGESEWRKSTRRNIY